MRKLTTELLDHLPHDDPGAIRSRRDLRRINRFMGNNSWILGSIAENPSHITEIGSGDGHLLSLIAKKHPSAPISAYDLAPRPGNLPENINWHQGDLFAQAPPAHGGVLIANLFLHHFTDDQLVLLSTWMRSFEILIFNEPLRSRIPLVLGKLAYPFIHPITRHDMRVSIEAGFLPGELPGILKLSEHGFSTKEISTNLGSMRILSDKA